MLDKYIKIGERTTIVVGQNNSGVWYCKELPAKDVVELGVLMSAISKLLNEHNSSVNVETDKKK